MEKKDMIQLDTYNFLDKAVTVNFYLLVGFTVAILLFVLSLPFIVYVIFGVGWLANIMYGIHLLRKRYFNVAQKDRRHHDIMLSVPDPFVHKSTKRDKIEK